MYLGAIFLLPDIKSIAAPIPKDTIYFFFNYHTSKFLAWGLQKFTNKISKFDLLISLCIFFTF